MTVLFIILVILVLILLWVIISPFYLKINTEISQYEITMPALFKVSYHPSVKPGVKFRILFVPFSPNFGKKKKLKKSEDPEIKISKKKTRKMISTHQIKKLILKFFNAFKINKLDANIDTGDYTLNSHLIPILVITGVENKININYQNINNIDLELRSNIYKFLYLGMWYIIKRK